MDYIINNDIKNNKIKIIDSDLISGKSIINRKDALTLSYRNNLDLIQINDQNGISVCILDNFDKFKYKMLKKEKERKKAQRENQVQIKEIQLRPVTDKNDISIKARKAKEFLTNGDKVRIVIKFRGREASFLEKGREVMDTLLSTIGDYKFEKDIGVNGKDMSCVLFRQKE